MTFRIAQMSTGLWVLTVVLLAIPGAMVVAVLFGVQNLVNPLAFVTSIYAWVWLRFRPGKFIIHAPFLEVAWPLKRRRIPRSGIVSVRILNAVELKREIGWGIRVGAGGLWGGFGWLWTKKRGIVQMYISRTDAFVWIERGKERSWLITPERPEEFVRELIQARVPVVQQSFTGDVPASRDRSQT